MGTKLPHLQKYRGGLGWQPLKTNSAEYSKHPDMGCTTNTAEKLPPGSKPPTATKGTSILNARLQVPPDTKLPALTVTTLQCTRQILGTNKALQRVGGEDGET